MILCSFNFAAERKCSIVIYEELRSYWAYLYIDGKVVCDTWVLNKGVPSDETSYRVIRPPDCHNEAAVCRYHLLEKELSSSDFRAFTNPAVPQSYPVYYKDVLVAILNDGEPVGRSAFAEVDSPLALAMDTKPDLLEF